MKQKMIPIISIIVGAVAFWLTHAYISARVKALDEEKTKLLSKMKMATVLGAGEDLTKGQRIDQKDLAKVEMDPKNLSKAIPLEYATSIIGRRLQMPVRKGEPIFWMEIEGGESGYTLSSLVQKERRAISLSVAGVSAVSGLLHPGDYVDILGTFTLPSKKTPGESELVALTLLQNVTVLATGQRMTKGTGDQRGAAASGYSSVTVEVTPREAELLVFAQQVQGRLTLALRNAGDVTYESDLPEVNFEHIEKKLPIYNEQRQKFMRGSANR